MNNLVIFIGVISALVLTIAAYNFDNPDYNQLLADELEELHADSYFSNARARRDAPSPDDDKCRKRKHKLCCGDEVFEKFHGDKKDIKGACFKEVTGKDKPDKHPPHGRPFDPFDCEKMQQRRSEMTCISQCVGQKNNIIDAKGNVKPEEYGMYVKDKLAGFKYLVAVQDKIIQGCLDDIKNATKTDGKCKPDGMIMDFCLFKNIQLNCPADQIKDKQLCEKLQERIKQGRDHFPGPPPPPPEH